MVDQIVDLGIWVRCEISYFEILVRCISLIIMYL
jgi:hypothetical protein